MDNVKKIRNAHAAKFGIGDVSSSFYSLIDKLEEHAKFKNPKLKGWDLDTYYDIAFAWMGKDKELKKKVDSLDFGTQT